MKTLYPTRFLPLFFLFILTICSTVTRAQCEWQQNDLFTRTQLDWDGSTSWFPHYDTIYNTTFGVVEIGLPGSSGYSIRFSSHSTVQAFFVQSGPANILSGDLEDVTSSPSAGFGGQLLALRLNVDFSDSNRMPIETTHRFGDIVLHDITTLPVNGMTVRQVLSLADTILGAGTSALVATTTNNIAAITDLVTALNNTFVNGTPSQFAQDHLLNPACNACPVTIPYNIITSEPFNLVLQSTDADGDSLVHTIVQQAGNGTGEMEDATLLFYNPNPGFIGTDFLVYSVTDGQCVVEDTVFITVECPTFTNWQQGELITYSQTQWGTSQSVASNLLMNEYGPLYFQVGGVLKVGIEGPEGQMIFFTSGSSVGAYLPSSGPADILTNSGSNPTTTSSGIYGGEVTALHLNVDFADGGVLQGTSNVLYGDLVLTGLTTLTLFNGLTVREILLEAENVLGGGSTTLTPSQMLLLVQNLNAAFQNGTPTQWAQDHLVLPCDALPINTTPVFVAPTPTCGSTIEAKVGHETTFTIKASDADVGDNVMLSVSGLPAGAVLNPALPADSTVFTWTPTANGTFTVTFTATDTSNATATCELILNVTTCPQGGGYWKNNTTWPVATLMLGTVQYIQAQLINILNMPVGNGNKADASLILAKQLIAVKLSIEAGAVPTTSVTNAIAAADALIGSNTIPMNIKVNTTLGQQMEALASQLDAFNNGSTSTGCTGARLASENSNLSSGFFLEQNIPNPFTENTFINYQLPYQTHVRLAVYNHLGQEVALLIDGMQTEGAKTVRFNAGNLPGGIYFCRMHAGDFTETVKLILIK